ncbi:MAG: hypothetical protein RBT71_10765 [Flavobacteriales bacterium]|jgi:hypothetical protein|nr:hypothetical protein [Flavobacteriales bacterium]
MSTRERHPLDDRFRELLHDAEADPPPHVWAGVRGSMPPGAGRRRWLPGLLLVLLLVGGTWALGPWSARDDTPSGGHGEVASAGPTPNGGTIGAGTAPAYRTGGPGPASTESTPATAEGNSAEHRPTDPAPALHGPAPGTATTPIVDVPASGDAPHHPITPPSAQAAPPVESRSLPVLRTAPGLPQNAPPIAQAGAPPPGPAGTHAEAGGQGGVRPVTAAPGLPAADATWAAVRPVRPVRAEAVPTPLYRPAEPMVLPRGEWWAGVQLGSYMYRYRWQGDDRRLTDALDAAHGTAAAIVPGLAVQRQWRSGWGLAAGLWAGVAEQRFHATDRRTWVEHDIHTYLVTLDGQVFVSNVDTVEHVMHQEATVAGNARRTVLFVPLEATWAKRVRRFHYGLRAGVVAELPLGASGAMPAFVVADGPLTAVTADRRAHNARRPAALSMSVGAELGFQLHERWAIAVGGRYMHATLPFAPATDAHGLADRWGTEFRLLHHIPCHR